MMGNDLQGAREARGLSREQLARIIGVTRQSIALIETGRMCPSTLVALRLAKALDKRMEDLFWEDDSQAGEEGITIYPEPFAQSQSTCRRAYLTTIAGKPVARSQDPGSALHGPPAHAVMQVAARTAAEAPAHTLKPIYQASSRPTSVFVSGCDVGLSILTQHVATQSHHTQGVWFNVTNQRALFDLRNGGCHIAAVHLPPSKALTELALDLPITAFHFATAELGWIVARGNPLGFRDAQVLQDGRTRLVNRPLGAGARHLLDDELQRAGVDPAAVSGYAFEVAGHLDVADAIGKGFADVGIGHAGAAALYGLDFLPVRSEQCSLLIRTDALASDPVQALLQALHSDRFRTELTAVGPYDMAKAGTVMCQ